MRISDSLYQRLTPTERFRLAIDAHARGDNAELRRLSDTCPERKYWCQDVEYSERMKASVVVALFATNLLLRARLALEPALAAQQMRADVVAAIDEHVSGAAAWDVVSAEESAMIQTAYHDRAGDVVGVRDGISQFAATVGLLPEKLLSLQADALPIWSFACELAEAHPPNGVMAAAVENWLSAMWKSLVPSVARDIAA